jgi:hypothetical protein
MKSQIEFVTPEFSEDASFAVAVKSLLPNTEIASESAHLAPPPASVDFNWQSRGVPYSALNE